MGNEWGSSVLKSCRLQEKVELPAGSTRKCLPWELYRAVSTDAGSACMLSAFVYSLSTESSASDGRHVTRADILQAAENNAKVVLSKFRHCQECFNCSLFRCKYSCKFRRVTRLQPSNHFCGGYLVINSF